MLFSNVISETYENHEMIDFPRSCVVLTVRGQPIRVCHIVKSRRIHRLSHLYIILITKNKNKIRFST